MQALIVPEHRSHPFLEDGLDLEVDRHLAAYRDTTAVHADGEVDAELASADLRDRGEFNSVLAPLVWAGAVRIRAPDELTERATKQHEKRGCGMREGLDPKDSR